MLNLRAAIAVSVCILGSATALWADSYQCTFKTRHVEKGLMPATLRIDWPNYLKPAHITDTITEANGLRNIFAEVPIENAKRVTFSWKLEQIFVPNLSAIVNTRSRGRVNVRYRATVFPKSGKVVLSAAPTVRYVSLSSAVRADGHCKVIK